MKISLSLNAALDTIDYTSFEGELGVRNITGVSSVENAKVGDATFLASAKFVPALQKSSASLIVLPKDLAAEPKPGQLFLRVENPSIEIAKLCELISQRMWEKPEPGIHRLANVSSSADIHPTATIEAFVTISDDVVIGAGSVIGSGCFIGEASRVGDECRLSSNVSLMRDTALGNRVSIHSGAVLGSDGFGYEFEKGHHRKIPQIGSVEVGDDVEIGANTTIDRGRFGPTVIGEGTKIDNLVQIGHNVVVGKHNILCAQVGIAGSTTLGDYVVMGGRAGASGHLKIGDGAQLSGQCVAFSDLDGGAKYGGAPAVSLVAYQRITVVTRRLPELFKRLTRLESQLLGDSQT